MSGKYYLITPDGLDGPHEQEAAYQLAAMRGCVVVEQDTEPSAGEPSVFGVHLVEDDAELKRRALARLEGIGRGVDMTHPDYCSTCDGACVCGSRQNEGGDT